MKTAAPTSILIFLRFEAFQLNGAELFENKRVDAASDGKEANFNYLINYIVPSQSHIPGTR